MLHSYTLENFRQDLIRCAKCIEMDDAVRLDDIRRILRVIEAIPAAERESRCPFLTPLLRQRIADAGEVSVQDVDEILSAYKTSAACFAEFEKRGHH